MHHRPQYQILQKRVKEPRQFIQVITGPRQVGKTTLVHQLLEAVDIPWHFSSADEAAAVQASWVDQQWETARLKMKQAASSGFLLVIDEIQKVKNWSNTIKKHWDKDSREGRQLKVILLGSSRLLLEEGLTESLAGRFERIYMGHWPFSEMQAAFGFSLDEFIWFGGYPGAAALIKDESRWKTYVRDSLVETTISKDILQLTRIYKPALLKRLFEFGSCYSGKILSYNKMLGQLVDAGNTTTLSNYLDLLGSAGLIGGLENFSGSLERSRASSPKLQVFNTAFLSVYQSASFQEIRLKPDQWGRHVESAVGAHLINRAITGAFELFYWRMKGQEVDFVLKKGERIIGLEVKSGVERFHKGSETFKKKYAPHKLLLVGSGGLPTEDFLQIDPTELF